MIRFLLSTFIIFLGITISAQSQDYPWRVMLRDKGNSAFSKGSTLYEATRSLHSARSIERRLKVRDENQLFTIEDAPLYAPYIEQITSIEGVKKLLELRWQNYIVIRCDSAKAEKIGMLPFVRKIERTSVRFKPLSFTNHNQTFPLAATSFPAIASESNCGMMRYGPSQNQLAMLQIPEFHALGMMGHDILTAFFDTGFRWKTHASLSSSRVIAEYDFIQNDSITANQAMDVPAQDDHGSAVFSTVGGFQQDSLIGAAPFASFLLAKTEDLPSETRLEEENYAAAVEWAEALGTDIISSSLGYSRMDNTDESYTYNDMNGSLPIVSRAVNDAVKRGVLCITAAGNNGGGERDSTISSPGDADSVITVAGVIPNGVNVVGFSSRGPTASKVLKPDVAAQASDVVMMRMDDSSSIRRGSGTSFATPLTAGFATLILSQFPELAPWQVKKAMFASAEKHDSIPHKILGYGVPKLKKALLHNGPVISRISSYRVGNYIRIVTAVLSQSPVLSVKLSIMFAEETEWQYITVLPTDRTPFYAIDIPIELFKGKDAQAYIIANDDTKERNFPCDYSGKPVPQLIDVDDNHILCGISPDSLPKTAVIADITHNDNQYREEIEMRDNTVIISTQDLNKDQIICTIHDILGTQLFVQKLTTENTVLIIKLDELKLPHGTYIITINDTHSLRSKIIVR